MSDQLLLLLAAVVASAAAWAFWHYLGPDAVNVLLLLAVVGALADNWRLRRLLRSTARKDE